MFDSRPARAVVATLAALCLASAPGTALADEVQPNIIGGHAPTQNYPAGAFVSLQYDAPEHGVFDWHTCGASVPTAGVFVRTAAHCVTDMPANITEQRRQELARRYHVDATTAAIPVAQKQFFVRVGSHDRTQGGIVAQATVHWVHPNWNWGDGTSEIGDIALLRVDRYLDVYELPLAPRAARAGDAVYQLGWGVTQPSGAGPVPTMVRELKTTILAKRHCAPGMVPITTREVCVSHVNGTDGACYGDSGGPLVLKINGVFYDAGVTSRGMDEWCGTGPDIYTSTPEYRTDIYNVMRGHPVAKTEDPEMTLPFERP